MTRTWPVAGAGFAVIWVFVRGPALAPAAILGSLLLGLTVGVPVAYVFRRLYGEELALRRSLRVLPAVVLYLAAFLREIVVANVDVAIRVLSPWRAIEPQVILVPLRVETALGVTTIANSITLTPGTLTLDYDADENALFVHIIHGGNPGAVVDPIRTWEDLALVIFDEPAAPGEPAPEITVHPPSVALPAAPAEVPPAPGEVPIERDENGGDDGGR